MVHSLLNNTEYTAFKDIFILDEESGEKRKVKRPKRIRT